MIDIFDISGTKISSSDVLSELLVTKDCQHIEELMKANYVKLSWGDTKRYELPVGAYIIPYPNEVNPYIPNDTRYPIKYKLFSPYVPEAKNTADYEYEPEFQHPIMWLANLPLMFITGNITSWADALKKTTWGYTGSATQIAAFIVNCINWIAAHDTAFGNTFGTGWVAMVDTNLAPNATVNFDSVDIMSGASAIAQAFDCEFHFDFARKQFRLGEIRYGTEVTLQTDVNVGVASVNRTKTDYHNAFLIKGGTKNLSQPTDTGENLQLTERLTLDPTTYPDSTIYTDNAGNIITREQFVALGVPALMEELIFDDVYPKLDLYLYNVRERKCWLLDEQGHRIEDPNGELDPTDNKRYKAYSKWYTRLAYPIYTVDAQGNRTISSWADYHATEDKIIEGQTLQITFLPNTESGAMTSLLIGQGDFDAVYFAEQTHEWEEDDIDPNGFTAEAGDYRIVQKEVSGLIIPTTSSGGIYPQGGLTPAITNNKSTLLNIVVDDTYKVEARQDLEMVAKRKVSLLRSDLNNYNLPSNPVYFEANNTKLHIGQAVIYNDGQTTPYTLSTHVLKIVTQLDYPFVQEITVGNQKVKGDISTMKEQIQTILSGGVGGSGSIDERQITTLIQTIGSQYFLSKVTNDTAKGEITFEQKQILLKGLQVGANFVPDILGEGGVLRMREDGKVELVTDILYARMKAYFDSVEIREYQHTGGNRIASVAGNRMCRIEWYDANNEVLEQTQDNLASVAYFRCYFRASDGEDTVRNNWVVGDLAYCHITSVANSSDNPEQKLNQKHLWRLVIGRNTEGTLTEDGEAYIDLSNRATETISGTSYIGYQSGSDAPEAQDDIIQLGNVNDTTRQGAIVEFVTGTDAPSYQIYQGINSFSLNNKNQIGFGYNTSTGRAYLNVYGDAYVGARDRSTFIEYKQSGTGGNPELNIKAHVEFTNTDQELDTLVQAHQKTYDNAIAALIRETEDLQAQIDGAIESYFMEGVPSLTTPPVMNTEETHYEEAWLTGEETQEERIAILNKHIGDLYYDKQTRHGYRFLYDDDTSDYVWAILTDEDVTEALRLASEAQETADGKSTTFLNNTSDQDESKRYPTNYKKGDTWILQADATIGTTAYKAGDILTASTDSETYSASHWSKQVRYTDDTKADSILNNTYYKQLAGGTINNLIGTAQDAADAAQDAADAAQADATNANNKLTAWADDGNISPTEKLALKNQKADVQKEYAQIITDAAKYSGVSTTAFTTAYNRAITAFDYYTSTSTENVDIITDEEEDSDETPRYSRIAAYYAARQTILEAITTAAKTYATTQGNKFLNDAVYKAISAALGSKTDIVGGLVLTSMIGMRQNTGTAQEPSYKVWGGINGEYDDWSGETHAKGHGIAAWYGGELLDKETLNTEQIAQGWDTLRWAKGVDRFDGSGYRANGNITWDETGALTIKNITTLSDSNNNNILNELATFNSAFTFGTSGQGSTTALYITPQVPFESLYIGTSNANKKEVATQEWVGNNYVSTAFFRQLFRAFKPNETAGQADVEVQPNTIDATISNIKAMVGFWTEQYISALGNNSDGGGGGASVLYGLNDVTPNATGDGVMGAQDGYVLTYNGTTNHWYAAATAETYVLPQATVDALGGIKIGYTTSGKNYAIALDTNGRAYVNVPWTDTTYTLAGLMGSTAIGGATQPIYWDGSAFKKTTYTLAKSVPADAKFTDTTYSFSNADATLAWSTRTKIATTGGTDIYVTLPANPNTNTWRNVFLDGTEKLTNGINTKGLNFVGDGKTTISFLAAGTEEGQSGNANYATLKISSTWRGIQDNLTSDSTTDSLSAKQGKNLKTSITTLEGYFTNGVAKKAAQLNTSRTLWGQNFNGSANVSGAMTDVTTIDGYVSFTTKQSSNPVLNISTISANTDYISIYVTATHRPLVLQMNAGNVGIGVAQPSYKLDVAGTFYASGNSSIGGTFGVTGATTLTGLLTANGNIATGTSDGAYIQIGGARIVWDNTNKALKVIQSDNSTAANFYATGAISALGQGEDGGGGGQGDVSWSALASNNDTRQIALSHLTTALSNYLQKGNIDDSYITSTVSWGALAGDSYTPLMQLRSPRLPNTSSDYGSLYICAQVDGQSFSGGTGIYMQIDGYFYQKGGSYRVLDTSDASGLSVNYANSAGSVAWANVSGRPTNVSSFTNDSGYITSSGNSAAAGLLKPNRTTSGTSYSASSWENPSSFSNYTIVWGEAFKNSSVSSSDTGDILFALRPNVYSGGVAQELCIAIDGDFYAAGGACKVLHEGNSSVSKSGETLTVKINGTSYSLTNTNTTYSASTGLSLSGTAFSVSYAPKVLGSYTSNGGQQNPNYFGTNRVGFLMMNTTVNGNSQYKDWVIMDCYSGNDVGGGVAIGVNRQSLGAYIMRSAAARTSWAESAELLGTHNYTTYTVKKDGTGASGSWGISITGSSASCTGNAATATKATQDGSGNTITSTYLKLSGGTIKNDAFAPLIIERTNSGNMAGIGFKNNKGVLGYIATEKVDGAFVRYNAAASTYYTILDSNNSSVSLSGSTLTVKINGTTQSLTNTWRGITNDYNPSSASESNSLSQKGAQNLYNAVTKTGARWSWGGNGNYGYCLVAEIDTGSGYINFPINFEFTTRGGRNLTIVTIRFKSQQAVDPDVDVFGTNGDTNFFLYKVETSKWRLYAQSMTDGIWGSVYLTRIVSYLHSRVTVKMENVSSLPTGYVTPSYIGNAAYATSAGTASSCSGNASTATTLQTSRTLWGQSFDGSANVSGNMTGVGTISASGNNTITKSNTDDTGFIAKNNNGQIELITSTNRGVYDRTGSNWLIATNGTNTFLSRGNVGIGTTSPAYKLDVNGTIHSNSIVTSHFSNDECYIGTQSNSIGSGNVGTLILTYGNHSTLFYTNATARMCITGAGRVGIGTTSPSYTFHVTGTFGTANGSGSVTFSSDNVLQISHSGSNYSEGIRLTNYNGTSGTWSEINFGCQVGVTSGTHAHQWTVGRNGNNNYFVIRNNRADRLEIDLSGNITVAANFTANGGVTALSDARHKQVVRDTNLSVEQIANMPSVIFKWTDGKHDNDLHVGTLAQPWQQVLPEVVLVGQDKEHTLSLSYGVAALVAAITTARKVVDHEQRIKALEKENKELREEISRLKIA